MKRYTFTCVLETDVESADPKRLVRQALTYGEKHQSFSLYPKGDIATEDFEEEE